MAFNRVSTQKYVEFSWSYLVEVTLVKITSFINIKLKSLASELVYARKKVIALIYRLIYKAVQCLAELYTLAADPIPLVFRRLQRR